MTRKLRPSALSPKRELSNAVDLSSALPSDGGRALTITLHLYIVWARCERYHDFQSMKKREMPYASIKYTNRFCNRLFKFIQALGSCACCHESQEYCQCMLPFTIGRTGQAGFPSRAPRTADSPRVFPGPRSHLRSSQEPEKGHYPSPGASHQVGTNSAE